MARAGFNEIASVIERFVGDPDGNAESEIEATERKLGVRLPCILRQTYSVSGRMVRLWDARARGCWQVRGLGGLRREGPLLVFAAEQQATFEWGVEIADPDGRVVHEGGGGDWKPTPESLTTFLCGVVLLHASSATLDWEGGAEVAREPCQRLVANWQHVAFRPLCGPLDFYLRGTTVLRCDWRADGAVVFAGGRDRAELEAVVGSLGCGLPEPYPDDAP